MAYDYKHWDAEAIYNRCMTKGIRISLKTCEAIAEIVKNGR